MTKAEAIELIDKHKNKLINPVEMLQWTHLRVHIAAISIKEWEKASQEALKVLSR